MDQFTNFQILLVAAAMAIMLAGLMYGVGKLIRSVRRRSGSTR